MKIGLSFGADLNKAIQVIPFYLTFFNIARWGGFFNFIYIIINYIAGMLLKEKNLMYLAGWYPHFMQIWIKKNNNFLI